MREVVATRCYTKKTFLKITQNSQKKSVLESVSNNIRVLQAVRLATLLKRNAYIGILEPAVHKCSLK